MTRERPNLQHGHHGRPARPEHQKRRRGRFGERCDLTAAERSPTFTLLPG